jgi:hypothetical protein
MVNGGQAGYSNYLSYVFRATRLPAPTNFPVPKNPKTLLNNIFDER